MDLLSVLTAIAGLIGGSGITGILFLRANRRKVNAEASHAEADADGTVVESMGKLVEQLQEQEDKYLRIIEQKDDKIEALSKMAGDVREEATTAEFLMCVNLGCVLRKPVQGRGKSWYETNRDDPSLGANYLPVNRLLQMYGKSKDEDDMRKYMKGRSEDGLGVDFEEMTKEGSNEHNN